MLSKHLLSFLRKIKHHDRKEKEKIQLLYLTLEILCKLKIVFLSLL